MNKFKFCGIFLFLIFLSLSFSSNVSAQSILSFKRQFIPNNNYGSTANDFESVIFTRQDVNGNGTRDLIAKSWDSIYYPRLSCVDGNGQSFVNGIEFHDFSGTPQYLGLPVEAGDVNADGRIDYAVFHYNSISAGWEIEIFDSFSCLPITSFAVPLINGGSTPFPYGRPAILSQDINRDGLRDLIFVLKDSFSNNKFLFSFVQTAGTPANSFSLGYTRSLSTYTSSSANVFDTSFFTANQDVDGDGVKDYYEIIRLGQDAEIVGISGLTGMPMAFHKIYSASVSWPDIRSIRVLRHGSGSDLLISYALESYITSAPFQIDRLDGATGQLVWNYVPSCSGGEAADVEVFNNYGSFPLDTHLLVVDRCAPYQYVLRLLDSVNGSTEVWSVPFNEPIVDVGSVGNVNGDNYTEVAVVTGTKVYIVDGTFSPISNRIISQNDYAAQLAPQTTNGGSFYNMKSGRNYDIDVPHDGHPEIFVGSSNGLFILGY